MSDTDIITAAELTDFLAHGAFVLDGDKVQVFIGPFQPQKPGNTDSPALSIPLFYQGDQLHVVVPTKTVELDKTACSRWLASHREQYPTPPGGSTPPAWTEPAREDFEKAFSLIQNMIAQGQLDKAVPVVFERAKLKIDERTKLEWILSALRAPTPLHPFGWWDGSEGMIGTTPEILFRVDGKTLETMALAGTLPRANGTPQDLLRSNKEAHEHQLVVDDITRQLDGFGSVRAGERQILELPTLWHLQTPISAELFDPPEFNKLLARMHPTAALGVSPRVFGWHWMNELPGQADRKRFGAPFTYFLNERRAIALVAIRALEWNGYEVVIGSGCGLVKDSRLDDEWRELASKRQSVKKIFGLVP